MELKLGKKPAKFDARTLQLTQAMKAVLPPVPKEWDYDQYFKVPTPMFLNDQLGDCVIAGRGHQTLRLENIEQKCCISISDQDVKAEYFKESYGQDSGLVMLDSLKSWRNDGWPAAGNTYSIHAFASVSRFDHKEVATALYLFTGLQCGFRLPQCAMDAFEAGKIWDVPSIWNWRGRQILGGHCIYLHGFDKQMNLFGTSWGQNFKMTWKFWKKYSDEAYAIIDSKDRWLANSPVDEEKLEQYLKSL